MAKDARDEPVDDALDVIDLITDEPVPTGRRIDPEPDEREPRVSPKRRLILCAIAALVVASVGVSVIVTRNNDDPQGVGIASDDSDPEGEDADPSNTDPPATVPDVGPDMWRALGSRFGLGIDTQVLLVDGATGTVDTPRTLPNGATRVVSGRGGVLFVVAGNSPVLLDGDGRLTDSDDAPVFPGIEPGVWWNVHERNVTPILGRANTVITPNGTDAVAAVRDGFVLEDDTSRALSLWVGGADPRPIAPQNNFFLVALHPDRIAWQGICPGTNCGLHVTEVATGRDVLLRGGIVPMFELGRAYGRFSPDGRYLALQVANRLSEPGNFVLVDLSTGAIVSRAEIAVRMPAPGSTGVTEAVPFDFTPDSQRVVVADWTQSRGRIAIIRTADGVREQTLDRIGRVSSLAALDSQPTAPTTPLVDGAGSDLGTGATLALASGVGDDFVTVDLDSGRQRTYAVEVGGFTDTGDFQPRLVALDGGFAWLHNGEAFFAPPDGDAVSLGAATFVMAGGTADDGWTVRRTADGYELKHFDGRTGALGATYMTPAAPEGAVRDGLVVSRPATFTHGSEIEIWNPSTGRARTVGVIARYPVITAAGGERVIWYDQACSDAAQSCGALVTNVSTGKTDVLPGNAYPFSASATTPTGDQLFVQVQDQAATRLASIDFATLQLTEIPESDNFENWAASSKGVIVFSRQGELRVWMPGWPESKVFSTGGFGPVGGLAVR